MAFGWLLDHSPHWLCPLRQHCSDCVYAGQWICIYRCALCVCVWLSRCFQFDVDVMSCSTLSNTSVCCWAQNVPWLFARIWAKIPVIVQYVFSGVSCWIVLSVSRLSSMISTICLDYAWLDTHGMSGRRRLLTLLPPWSSIIVLHQHQLTSTTQT